MSDKSNGQNTRWATNPNIAAETWGSGYPYGTNTVNDDYQYTRQREEDGGENPSSDSFGQDLTEDDMRNMKACSAMECTGLIPSLPQSDSELESYAEIYHYPADGARD